MDATILTQRDSLLELVIDRLGEAPIDYAARLAAISGLVQVGWRTAGVLVLLYYRTGRSSSGEPSEYCFQVIKRSTAVPQSGDLSCLGGMTHPWLDRLLSSVATHPLLPIMRGKAREQAKSKGRDVLSAISLFLANALRESWEEVRLSPLNVGFLGALPSYDLPAFRRSIFPIVGYAKRPWVSRPNWEVDKVVEIPLRAFLRPESYGTVRVEAFVPLRTAVEKIRNLPCLILEDGHGGHEILWGATLNIMLQFFRTVLHYEPPMLETGKVVNKSLFESYYCP